MPKSLKTNQRFSNKCNVLQVSCVLYYFFLVVIFFLISSFFLLLFRSRTQCFVILFCKMVQIILVVYYEVFFSMRDSALKNVFTLLLYVSAVEEIRCPKTAATLVRDQL